MSNGIPKHLIPPVSKADLKAKYEHDLEAWRNFSARAQRNSSMKAHICQRDKICQACGQEFDEDKEIPFLVHHIDYDHSCRFEGTIQNEFKRQERERPDCGRCKDEQPSLFQDCAARLAAVHRICNLKIEKMAQRYYRSPKVAQNEKAAEENFNVADSIDWFSEGAVFIWKENIKSYDKLSESGRRRLTIGTQEVTGRVEIIEGDYLIVKILNAQVIEKTLNVEFIIYRTGELIRKKRSTFIRRQAQKI